MKNRWIDFHTHTTYSDGMTDPESLVRQAFVEGTEVLAITDHDTMRGYFAGRKAAEKYGLELVPGVEVSTENYHILGLSVDPDNSRFQKFLAEQQERQRKTCASRVEILTRAGIPISMEKLQSSFPESRLGKWNVHMTLFMDRECREDVRERFPGLSVDEIFGKLMRRGGIAHKAAAYDISSKEAIDEIHAAGGIAVIAHPFKDVKEMKEMDRLVEEGIDGLEIQPNYGERNEPFRAYALKAGLMLTYGSDHHGLVSRPLLGRRFPDTRMSEELEQSIYSVC